MRLGVAFGGHSLAWDDLAALVGRADQLGYAAAYTDGDVTQLGRGRECDVLDGWTVTTTLLARTRSIGIGSIRLVQRWNAAHLAQVAATAQRLAPGRLQFFASIGDRPEDTAWGYPPLPVAERIAWLDETLDAARALWRGEQVTRRGRFVTLEGARVRPVPPAGGLPVEIAARGPRLLRVVARHAEIWNVNWPPIPARVAESAAALEAACRETGRPLGSVRRRLWIFTRARPMPAAEALGEFRRLNPWFESLADAEVSPALVVGSPAECRDQLGALARELDLELPVLDLSGLGAEEARETLEAFPAGKIR